jgi:competence protein ComEC
MSEIGAVCILLWAQSATLFLATNPLRWILLTVQLLVAVTIFQQEKTLVLMVSLISIVLFSLHTLALEKNQLAKYVNKNKLVKVEFRASSDGSELAPKIINGLKLPPRYTQLENIDLLTVDGISYHLRLPIRIISNNQISLEFGEVGSAVGILKSTTEQKVAAMLITRIAPEKTGAADIITRLSNDLRDRFHNISTTIAGDSGALLPGFVLGDTTLESANFAKEMQYVGLTHLTAVSGENFSILALALGWLLERITKNGRFRIFFIALCSLWFIYLARPSGSVLRAAVMTALYLFGKWRGLEIKPINALFASLIFLILFDPYIAIDPGFTLSFLATLGIFLIYPRVSEYIFHLYGENRFTKIIAITISASLLTIPIVIWISGQFSLTGLISNALVEITVAPITIIGLVAAVVSVVSPILAHYLLDLANPFCEWIVLVARYLSKIPPVPFPKGSVGALLSLIIMGAIALCFRLWRFIW